MDALLFGILILGSIWLIGKWMMGRDEAQLRKWTREHYGREPTEAEIQKMHDDNTTAHGPV